MDPEEQREYVCPETNCSASFKTLSHMNTHLLVHSQERPFVCLEDDCSKSFKRNSHLQRHQLQCHEKTSSFKCNSDGCDKTFCSSTSLRRHENRRHLNPKYKCSICDIVLFNKKKAQTHEAQHKDEKPFRCTVEGCGKSFATPSRLGCHQKQHRGYRCPAPDCSMIFYKWSLLSQHKKSQHPKVYPCSQCEKVFHSNFNLKKHQVVHSESREVHHCSHESCSRQYFDFKNLNAHLKRFHGDQCFVCPNDGCERKFAHKKSLLSHIESHTKPKEKKQRTKKNHRYNFVKRRSAAAMLSGFEADKADEKAILSQDRELTLSSIQKQLEEIRKSQQETVSAKIDTQHVQQCLIAQTV